MDPQVEKILELSKILYEKGAYSEAWEGFSQAYRYTRDEVAEEMLLNYFYYPNENMFRETYRRNQNVLKNSKKVYGYNLEKDWELCTSRILWDDNDALYYLEDKEIKQQEIIECMPEEDRRVTCINIVPENIPKYRKYPFVLYYDEKAFECYMQIASFAEILGVCDVILVEKGLEAYIEQFQDTGLDSVWGVGAKEFSERITRIYQRIFYPEKRISCGTLYENYIFYVIRMRYMTSSLGPLVLWVLKQLKMAKEKGYIPVIDFSCFKNIFLEDDEIGKINPWEYYFEQPTQFGLQAAYHAKHVILGDAEIHLTSADLDALVDNPEVLQEYSQIFNKYIHISKRIEKKSMLIFKNLIKPEWRVLGVAYRGTDYRNRVVVNEHRQPRLDDIMEKAAELLESWNCDHIFLATEDKGAVDTFTQKFGEKVVYVDKERYDSSVEYTFLHHFPREFDAYFKGEEYLSEIYILSKCNCLLSGRCGILGVALPMNEEKYEEKYIYDLGLYTAEDYK